jgi:hypothetical protein
MTTFKAVAAQFMKLKAAEITTLWRQVITHRMTQKRQRQTIDNLYGSSMPATECPQREEVTIPKDRIFAHIQGVKKVSGPPNDFRPH